MRWEIRLLTSECSSLATLESVADDDKKRGNKGKRNFHHPVLNLWVRNLHGQKLLLLCTLWWWCDKIQICPIVHFIHAHKQKKRELGMCFMRTFSFFQSFTSLEFVWWLRHTNGFDMWKFSWGDETFENLLKISSGCRLCWQRSRRRLKHDHHVNETLHKIISTARRKT